MRRVTTKCIVILSIVPDLPFCHILEHRITPSQSSLKVTVLPSSESIQWQDHDGDMELRFMIIHNLHCVGMWLFKNLRIAGERTQQFRASPSILGSIPTTYTIVHNGLYYSPRDFHALWHQRAPDTSGTQTYTQVQHSFIK